MLAAGVERLLLALGEADSVFWRGSGGWRVACWGWLRW